MYIQFILDYNGIHMIIIVFLIDVIIESVKNQSF